MNIKCVVKIENNIVVNFKIKYSKIFKFIDIPSMVR